MLVACSTGRSIRARASSHSSNPSATLAGAKRDLSSRRAVRGSEPLCFGSKTKAEGETRRLACKGVMEGGVAA
jgi:hypothetical protein